MCLFLCFKFFSSLEVKSCAQEAEFRLHAMLKTRCIGYLEGVKLLSFEKTLHKGAGATLLRRACAPEELCGEWNMARALIEKEVQGKKKSAETLRSALSRKNDAACEIDSSFVLDSAFWSSFLGELGENFLAEQIAAELPTPETPEKCTPSQVQKTKI